MGRIFYKFYYVVGLWFVNKINILRETLNNELLIKSCKY
jgi:hypothetical protein